MSLSLIWSKSSDFSTLLKLAFLFGSSLWITSNTSRKKTKEWDFTKKHSEYFDLNFNEQQIKTIVSS